MAKKKTPAGGEPPVRQSGKHKTQRRGIFIPKELADRFEASINRPLTWQVADLMECFLAFAPIAAEQDLPVDVVYRRAVKEYLERHGLSLPNQEGG